MRLRRFLALAACLLLILGNAGCTGARESWLDDFAEQLRTLGQRQANTRYLTVHQLVQKLADAMRHDNNVMPAYDGIPERQKDSLSRDQFQQYVRFLRRGISGTISSFSEMSEPEIERIRAEIGQQLPGLAENINDLSGFWIHYQEAGRIEEKFAVFVRDREGQHPDLYGDWVGQILDLQDLATLYFDALDRLDTDALAVLLQPRDFPEDVLKIRADKLIRFYRSNIATRSSEFKLTHARPDRIGFEAFGIINPDRTQSVSRKIEMVRQADGSYLIDDVIPEVIHEDDLQINFKDIWLLQFGQTDEGEPVQVHSGELESIIGAPIVHNDSVCTTTASGTQRMELTYQGLRLKAEGNCFRHSRWNGLVSNLVLTGTVFSLGSGLSPGDSEADLLRLYPGAREADYVIKGKTDYGDASLAFTLRNGKIASIELTLH